MTPEKKLSDVFNTYAEKVVEAREFETLFRRAMEENLTKGELRAFLGLPAPKGEPDLSSGIYEANCGVFVSGDFLRRNMPEDHIPPALIGKIAGALDDAFEKAVDHSDAVKNGDLKPLEPLPPKKRGTSSSAGNRPGRKH